MKQKLLKILMILLLSICSENLFGQTDGIPPLQGDCNNLVALDIETIRAANVKLNERLLLLQEINIKDSIIVNLKELNSLTEDQLRGELIKQDSLIVENNNKDAIINKLNKKVKVREYTCYGLSAISLLILLFL